MNDAQRTMSDKGYYVTRSMNGWGVYRGVLCYRRTFTKLGAMFMAWRWNRRGYAAR